MKIRTDFVTNSSSSSFVIGKKDEENITIETVYQMIRNLYKELISKREELQNYLIKTPKLGIEYVSDENGYSYFQHKKGYSFEQKNSEIRKGIERDFGKNVMGYLETNTDWLNCDTYEEYEKYWLKKMEGNKDWRVHAPFTIVDFLEEREVTWLHYRGKEIHKIDSSNDVFGWYFPYFDDAMTNPDNCDSCDNHDWCDKDDCLYSKELLKNNDLPLDKICLHLLGRVCICSECGYINDWVVDKLKDFSEQWCNHMG